MAERRGEQPLPGDQANATTLWVGDLGFWMDESYLYNLFVGSGELQSVKVIRNKVTGASEGYGFIEFRSHEAAEAVLKTFNGVPIPNTEQVFRLNWAAFGVGRGASEDFSVFVGDLAPEVTDYVLQENFRQFFPSVRSAKVITDPLTGKSKGYGFVRFGNEAERDRALAEMNGHFLSSRPIRVSLATAKKSAGGPQQPQQPQQHQLLPGMPGAMAMPGGDVDPTNTTLFIGGLSGNVSEAELRSIFGRFGDIVYVKIPTGKGCGFVQYVDRGSAERAMAQMHGQVIGNGPVRISWGRSSAANRGAAGAHPMAGAAGFPFGAGAGFGHHMYGHHFAAPGAFPGAMYGAGGPAGAQADFAAAYGSAAGFGPADGGMAAAAPGASFFGAAAAGGYGPGSVGGKPGMASDGGDGMMGGGGGHMAHGNGKHHHHGYIPGLGGGAGVQQGGGGGGGPGSGKDEQQYDPLAQMPADGLNGSYMQNHQPGLVGSHLFA